MTQCCCHIPAGPPGATRRSHLSPPHPSVRDTAGRSQHHPSPTADGIQHFRAAPITNCYLLATLSVLKGSSLVSSISCVCSQPSVCGTAELLALRQSSLGELRAPATQRCIVPPAATRGAGLVSFPARWAQQQNLCSECWEGLGQLGMVSSSVRPGSGRGGTGMGRAH